MPKKKMTKTKLLKGYRRIMLIRIAEEEIAKYYLANKVMSFVHFYVGEEAIAVGVSDALNKDDRVMGNHRSHGHYLAKGGDLKKMVAELLGKKTGIAGGKGGSMHMMDKSVHFIGGTPILGAVVSLANGSAFEQKYNKRKSLTVVYCGDGAFEEGVVYETLNLAALFKLPLLLVVENNLYSVNSKIRERRSKNHDPEKIIQGFGLRYLKADGHDYVDVFEKAKILTESIRSGKGPAVLECLAYRHMAHSAPIFDDAQGYREEDVLEKRLEKDPVKITKGKLEALGVSAGRIAGVEKNIRIEVAEAIRAAAVAPYPPAKDLLTDVYHG